MENIVLTLNGQKISCSSGTSVLEAAGNHKIYIPTLCYHPDLKPHGGCRLCLVEDKNSGKLLASCVTPAVSGMDLDSNSERIIEHRRNIIRLMMAEHPESCILCSQGNRCQLRKIAGELGIGETNLYPMPNYTPYDFSTPFISRDLTKCIMCGKCIRACDELVVTGAVNYSMRGFKSRPATVHYLPLKESECTLCGTCVSICPTGALVPTGSLYGGTSQYEYNSVCGFCGVGCNISLGVTNDKVVEVNPAGNKESPNNSTLCVRGYFAHDYLNTETRLTEPLIKKNGETVPVSWEEAVDSVAEKLILIKNKYGPDSIGFFGSSKCTNEENYLFQKLSRAVIGTNNIDNGGFRYGRESIVLLDMLTNGSSAVNRLKEIENSEVIIVIGADPTQSTPVMGYHIKRAAKNGTKLVVINSCHTELSDYASVSLTINSGSMISYAYFTIFNTISLLLHEKQGKNIQLIGHLSEDFHYFINNINTPDFKSFSIKTGVKFEELENVSEILSDKKAAIVIGSEILDQNESLNLISAIYNLAQTAGNFSCKNGSIHICIKENNLLGSLHMGTVPNMLPGLAGLGDSNKRDQFEKIWGARIPLKEGFDIIEMIEAAEKGKLKAIYIMGENPLRAIPQKDRIKKALENLECLIVQDVIATETTLLADILLPGAPFSEKSGSFTNLEGKIQTFSSAVHPPERAMSDFNILSIILSKLQNTNIHIGVEEVRDEIAELVPLYSDYKEKKATGWARKKTNDKEVDPRISFAESRAPKTELPDSKFPYCAILKSPGIHSGSGTRTAQSYRINHSDTKGDIELSYEDYTEVDFNKGNKVKIISKHGFITRKVKVNPDLPPGVIIIPAAFNGNDVMDLLPLKSPGSKEFQGWDRCAVRIEKALHG